MLVIVNYGMGNIGSIENMLLKAGAKNVIVSSSADDINSATKLIIPGVGNFGKGVTHIDDLGLRGALNTAAIERKIPVMGVCLGMQLMANSSEEGAGEGLGWFDAEVKKISVPEESNLRVPHMGWNFVNPTNNNPIFNGLERGSRFYHVHSYYVKPKNQNDICCVTKYGADIATGIAKNNIYGFQFHPEKSHKYGRLLFENFLNT